MAPFPFWDRTQTDLLAAPGRRPSSLPAPNSSSVHTGTGTDTHWCPFGHLHPQQWWRPGDSGRLPFGEEPARVSCCRWCWHPEPPLKRGPCRMKRDAHICTHTHHTHRHTQRDSRLEHKDIQTESFMWDFPEQDRFNQWAMHILHQSLKSYRIKILIFIGLEFNLKLTA